MNSNAIIIICKSIDEEMYKKYQELLEGSTYFFIVDKETSFSKTQPNIIYYPAKIVIKKGYKTMVSFKRCSAWDKAICFIIENNNYQYYWLLEDDVYFNHSFLKIIKDYTKNDVDYLYSGWFLTKKEMPKWHHWKKGMKYFKKSEITASLNQFIRIGQNMIAKIKEFKDKNNKLLFHEILFASLCKKHKLSLLFMNNPSIYMSANDYRKRLDTNAKIEFYKKIGKEIVHPIKNWHKIS